MYFKECITKWSQSIKGFTSFYNYIQMGMYGSMWQLDWTYKYKETYFILQYYRIEWDNLKVHAIWLHLFLPIDSKHKLFSAQMTSQQSPTLCFTYFLMYFSTGFLEVRYFFLHSLQLVLTCFQFRGCNMPYYAICHFSIYDVVNIWVKTAFKCTQIIKTHETSKFSVSTKCNHDSHYMFYLH